MKTLRQFALTGLWILTAGVTFAAEAPPTLDTAYPGLARAAFATATLGDLPEGVLVRFGEETITQGMLNQVVTKAPESMKAQLRKNALFLVQEIATKKLLLRAATEAALRRNINVKGKSEPQIISKHLQALVADVRVTDAQIAEFYAQNPDMFGGAKLAKVKDTLRMYLRKTGRQEAVDRYVRGLGGAYGVVISRGWAKTHAALAMDNPVDKARRNGKPSLVDFGSKGCRACDMLAPILETLKKKYDGKANILFVSVVKEKVLAIRFGIKSIPVQVFLDKNGGEVFRHAGFWPQEALEKKLAEIGVK